MSVTDAGVTPLRQKVPGKHFLSALNLSVLKVGESRHWYEHWRGMVLPWALLSLRNARAVAIHEASLGICRNARPK